MVKKVVQIPSFCTIFEKLSAYWRRIGANSFFVAPLFEELPTFWHRIGANSFFCTIIKKFLSFWHRIGAKLVQKGR